MNQHRLQQILESAKSCRFAVIGDVMLDEFVWGKVSRISPEAPVPIVEVQSESFYPGGAANVARNLRPFCEAVHICGVIGKDASAARLKGLLAEELITGDGLIELGDSPTIVKTRIIARQQQVVRVDRERRTTLADENLGLACDTVAKVLPDVSGVIFEDYGKGLLTQEFRDRVVKMAAGKMMTADPNPKNQLEWSGVHTLKPNRSEAFSMAGVSDDGAVSNPLEDKPLLKVGRILLEKWRIPSLLITLSEDGMILFEEGKPAFHTPTRAREVFDVSGAGDTAIALYTLALCAGATTQEAAEISNHASGVVVGKLGTATVTPGELVASFELYAS